MIKYKLPRVFFVEGVGILAVGFALLSVWIPVINHYYVPGAIITDEMIQKARNLPENRPLEELKSFSSLNFGVVDEKTLVNIAEKLLKGEVKIPKFPASRIRMPFDVSHLDKRSLESSTWQLHLAGFIVPAILLRAYEMTGRDDFIIAAKDVIVGWALYERSAWLPRGLLWNDHAIAARIPVLAEFWRLYRNYPDYQLQVAKVVFQLVARSGQFLAKSTHFAFHGNHGVMQNLALWHLCLAFPTLPNVNLYEKLALDRMNDQMVFHVNEEGVVLEHSAYYHMSGLRLMGMALRYLTLLNMPIPADWKQKYESAKDFYAQLRRPDGSLPIFGDTPASRSELGPLVTKVDDHGRGKELEYKRNWIPQRPNSLYPVAGYSVWWDGLDGWPNIQKLAQTVVMWSHFPGHPHKHADEMSVLLWAGGQTWWTNVGYWPYGKPGRLDAVSWDGSNAPHLINEDTKSVRNTRCRFFGWTDYIAVIDLERTGPQRYAARRQLVHLKPNLWFVIDSISSSEKSRVVWTTSHNVKLSQGRMSGSFELQAEDRNLTLATFFSGSDGTDIRQFKGSSTPFAGWEVIGTTIESAPAIVVVQPPGDSWLLTMWALGNDIAPYSRFVGPPRMAHWKNAENWEITLQTMTGMVNIWRNDNMISVRNGRVMEGAEILKLTEAPNFAYELTQIHKGYVNASNKYIKFRVFLEPRKSTWLLIFIGVTQEIFFLFYKKIGRRYYVGMRVFSIFSWVGIGLLFILF